MMKKAAMTVGVASLLTLGLWAQAPQQQAPAATDQGPSAKEKFKNIKVLNMPASQLRDTMEYFTAALGTNCGLCHVVGPNGDFAADDRRPKDTARKMIQMVDAFNANPDKAITLTCATCHHGKQQAERTPPLAVEMTPAEAAAAAERAAQFAARGGGPGGGQPGGGQPGGGQPGGGQPGGPGRGPGPGSAPGGAPAAAPGGGAPGQAGPGRGGPPRPTETVDDVINKYVQAIGGAEAIANAKTLVVHGTQTTRDLVTTPITVQEKATGAYRIDVDSKPRPRASVSDGKVGWVQEGANARDLEGVQAAQVSRGSELAIVALKQRYPNLQVGRYGNIDGVDTIFLAARTPAATEQFHFERQSGLLKRRIIQTQTPYGALVEQVDYSDYRDAGAIKVPFQVKYTSWHDVTTEKISDAKINAPVEDSAFAKK